MRETKSRAPLVLMEQVIMVLVFAMAAAFCVQAFALSGKTSRALEKRDHAMNVSQTLAETVKACEGDLKQVQNVLGGEIQKDGIALFYDADWEPVPEKGAAVYQAAFVEEEKQQFCRKGQVTVEECESGKELYSLPAAWQEGRTDE